jgi:hypothetical protein
MNEIDDRVCITEYDSNGVVVSINYGKTQSELRKDHEMGKCDAFCAICYADACDFAANNPDLIN